MSKSPKALLPSSLSLASLSRALPGTQTAASSHAAARSGVSLAVTTRHAQRDSGRHAAAVVVRHRRPASSLTPAGHPTRRTATATATAGATNPHDYSDSPAGAQGGALLRRARSTASTASSASAAGRGSANSHFHPHASRLLEPGTSYAVAGPSRPRYFHSAACERHQQSVSPASGGVMPPPGSGGPPSPGGSAAVDGGAFHPKHHSSMPLASHDGPLLPGSVAPGSGSGQSPPTAVVDPSSSSSPASSSQSQSTNATSTAIPATLFSHPPPASIPNHALPAFFGSALNIARRSNLVFRNGAYGIPKTDYHRARSSVKGKEKAIAPVDETEHYLSVGVGEDSVRFLGSFQLMQLNAD